MKVFLNFVPLKAGGGLQIGLDFVENLRSFQKDWVFYLAYSKNTPFHKLELPCSIVASFAVDTSLVSRVAYEYWGASRLIAKLDADVVYTQFGPALRNVAVPQISGCAYSNLFYPEVDFWAGERHFKRKIREYVDYIRLSGVARSDIAIFETPDLRDRCMKMLGFSDARAKCVLPSVSKLVDSSRHNMEMKAVADSLAKRKYIVYITRYHLNKNLELLIDAAELLNRMNCQEFAFLLTLDIRDARVCRYFERIESKGLSNFFVNVGPVPPSGCVELYRISTFAVLASNLESFSNNIAESWSMGVPLLVTEKSWAKALCGDGAHYFSHNDPQSLVNEILYLDENQEHRRSLVRRGASKLGEFPSSQERFNQYIDIINAMAV